MTTKDAILKKIKDAVLDEYMEHKSCHYEIGCILESITLDKRLSPLLDEVERETREKTIKILESSKVNDYEAIGIGVMSYDQKNTVDAVIEFVKFGISHGSPSSEKLPKEGHE